MAECDKVNGVYVMDTAPTDRLRSTRGLFNPLMSSLRLPRFERAIVAGFRGFTVVSLLSLVQLVLRRKFNSQSWVRNRFVEKRYELKKLLKTEGSGRRDYQFNDLLTTTPVKDNHSSPNLLQRRSGRLPSASEP
jgi:hypothetical protein